MNEKQSRLDVLKNKKEQLNAQIQKLEALQKARSSSFLFGMLIPCFDVFAPF